jgi:hypothetical protein
MNDKRLNKSATPPTLKNLSGSTTSSDTPLASSDAAKTPSQAKKRARGKETEDKSYSGKHSKPKELKASATPPVRRQRAADRQAALQEAQKAAAAASERDERERQKSSPLSWTGPSLRRSELSLDAYFKLPLKIRMQVNDDALDEDLAILRAGAI